MECPHCKKQYEREVLLKHLMVCPDCGYHLRMDVPDRIAYLADEGTFEELDTTLRTMNPIQMAGYEEKISAAEAKTSMNEAIVTGTCKIEGRDALLGIMSFDFLGGSMGSVVGGKISRLMMKGATERIPVIIYATSGGARMQEGLFSLMQMAKTSSAAAELDDNGKLCNARGCYCCGTQCAYRFCGAACYRRYYPPAATRRLSTCRVPA